MHLFPREGAALQRVRLRGDAGDALRARQRLDRMLNEVDWSPPSLGRRELLFVRRLSISAARGFAPRSEGGGFSQQVSAALRERAGAARRPWLHPDASAAEAVLFADEAELAACLWRDWVRGEVVMRWWWAGVLKNRPVPQWLREQLFMRGERLVPAMALLAAQGELRACIERLGEVEASVAVRAVHVSHAMPLPEPVAVASRRSQGADASMAASAGLEPEDAQGAEAARPLPLPGLRRLVALVPELRGLVAVPAARQLLAMALAVQRAPAWARSRPFALALAQLDDMPVVSFDAPIADRPASAAALVIGAAMPVRAGQVGDAAPSLFVAADAPATKQSRPQAQEQAVPSRNEIGAPRAADGTGPIPVAGQAGDGVAGELASTDGEAAVRAAAPQAVDERAARLRTLPTLDPAVDRSAPTVRTDWGGLFYLLNVALAWRIYGDFTMPRAPGISLSPWDLLAWTGREWFGEPFERDALWHLLAQLGGRDMATRPGDDFDDAPDWQPQLASITEVHPGRRWLQHWRVAVEARLRSALGREADVIGLLCRHRAEVAVSESAVDVTLSLADLPLQVRYAGLDRDPGWIPAAGRSVMFHFD